MESNLNEYGLLKKALSEPDIPCYYEDNIFWGKLEMNKFKRNRSASLSNLLRNMTINRMNSDSTFGESNTANEKCVDVKNKENVNEQDVFLTPTRSKRPLSPNEYTPLGVARKMSTDVDRSPILRMRFEFWRNDNVGVNKEGSFGGINRLGGADDSALSAENRYGLVGKGDSPGTSPGHRYGLVGNDMGPPVDGGMATAPATMVARRLIKTPRRRLLSEGIFGWMMENRNTPTETTKRRSRSHSQRSGVKGKLGNQKLMSEFVSKKLSPR